MGTATGQSGQVRELLTLGVNRNVSTPTNVMLFKGCLRELLVDTGSAPQRWCEKILIITRVGVFFSFLK